MKSNDMVVDNSVMNKKLLNTLPRSWDSNVTLIKRTKDLARLTLSETISLIKSYDLDDRQRYMTQTASYNNVIIATPSNALMSQQEPQRPSLYSYPASGSSYPPMFAPSASKGSAISASSVAAAGSSSSASFSSTAP